MRGQKARSGSGVRDGFEGGQTPLYRRLPKLKGIAGGKRFSICFRTKQPQLQHLQDSASLLPA